MRIGPSNGDGTNKILELIFGQIFSDLRDLLVETILISMQGHFIPHPDMFHVSIPSQMQNNPIFYLMKTNLIFHVII